VAQNGLIGTTSDFPHTIRQAVVENGQGRKEITCLIVDDHEVVREGLRLSLSRAPHIRVVGEASDGATAVALAERRKPDVVIMDVRMPGMDGLEATKILTEKVPETAVLIFTAYSERSLLGRGLESGAKGYILKEAPHQTLLKAIDKVVAGDGFVDPALMPAFLGDARDEMLTGRRHVERGRRRETLHQPGDRQEPRAAHPHEARGGHADARRCDCASRRDHRLRRRLRCRLEDVRALPGRPSHSNRNSVRTSHRATVLG
jgi:DNA-binding NarL/FixJ family response regulator